MHDRNELWVPFGMQNVTSCVALARKWIHQLKSLVLTSDASVSMGNATSAILHTKWYPQFNSVVQPPFSPTTFLEIGVYRYDRETHTPIRKMADEPDNRDFLGINLSEIKASQYRDS